ncbi:MAG: TonB-dependent receptor [Chitinophagaceae bacterium]|nr:MAG: TonB-dependent receptor [Chitinophagaceae bacterium]
MKYLLSCLVLCCTLATAHAQNRFRARIISAETKTALPGTSVTWQQAKRSVVADSTGTTSFSNIPDGEQVFLFTHIGFEAASIRVLFPAEDSVFTIELTTAEAEEDEEAAVIVTAMRTSRTIANTPTRTEVISGEELDEKANMKPGDIRMLLSESTGIQTQQTSATSYSAGIRIQGLDGRYTQILRDGYPMYAGFSGGLSILQIAPLDLRQVEVIKGSASTLYGGGAIAGLVNLVSKTPGEDREISLLVNGTTARGLDLSAFYSERYGKTGLTVFGSRNSSAAFDPANIGFTAIPKAERYTINPRFFVYGKKLTADIGFSYITEDRIGGDMDFIKKGGTGFYEENKTNRLTTQFGLARKTGKHSSLQLKNSYSRFSRSIAIPSYEFEALQQSSFTELDWTRKGEKADWVIGANLVTDKLAEQQRSSSPLRSYQYNTVGLFIQNAWTVSGFFTLETGLRGDYVNEYGFELLPRVSAMFRINPSITTRIGGGYGYKSPTIFTEDAERSQFRRILPIDINATRNERSMGGNWDLNYRTRFGEFGFSINHLFFYTRLNRPLVLTDAGNGEQQFVNSTGHIDTKGMETNIKLSWHDFKLFVGYTYTDAYTHFGPETWLPLTARHRLNNVLMYEVEEKWKIGLEAYYFSPQRLNDGSKGEPYWIAGFMVEKFWEKFSVFINFENFGDTRQTKFGPIYTGPVNNPVFNDIYAPVDGFVINGGFKIRL